MICAKCGSAIEPTERFCSECGEKIPETLIQPPESLAQTPEIILEEPLPKKKPASQPLNKNGLALRFFQAFIMLILASGIFLFAFWENSVIVKTTSSENLIFGDFSLLHVIGSLVVGTEQYNPSVLSIVMGITAFIFIFSAAAFWLFSVIALLMRKGENGMRRIAAILTFLALGAACSLVPLAYNFVSQFKDIYTKFAGAYAYEMKSISSPVSYVWAGIVVLLVIAIWIFTFKRKNAEGKVNENEK